MGEDRVTRQWRWGLRSMANDMMFSGLTESILPPANSDNRYFNRELSWLAFNERVLALAEDVSLPLAERLRFVSISADNLHEFFMVRIAGLRQLQQRGIHRVPVDDTELDTLLSLLHQRSSNLPFFKGSVFHFTFHRVIQSGLYLLPIQLHHLYLPANRAF